MGIDVGREIERRFRRLVELSDLRIRQAQVERSQVRLKLVRPARAAKRIDGDLGRPSCACVVSVFLMSL
jgi:hypothetical protein